MLAHVRRATVGPKTVLNCHPFQYGKWTFAHNGTVARFAEKREELIAEVAPRLRRFILGDTDSEVLFFILISRLAGYGPLAGRQGVDEVVESVRATVQLVRNICDDGAEEPSLLTFIVTDGVTLVATHGGRELFWSTYKTRCQDRDACPHLAPECEAPSQSGYVNHLIFSSEVIKGDNVWTALATGDIMGVDWRMRVARSHVERKALPVVA